MILLAKFLLSKVFLFSDRLLFVLFLALFCFRRHHGPLGSLSAVVKNVFSALLHGMNIKCEDKRTTLNMQCTWHDVHHVRIFVLMRRPFRKTTKQVSRKDVKKTGGKEENENKVGKGNEGQGWGK